MLVRCGGIAVAVHRPLRQWAAVGTPPIGPAKSALPTAQPERLLTAVMAKYAEFPGM
jgi:hypothetical protein